MPAVVLVFMAIVFWIFHSSTAPGRIISAVGVNVTTASYFGISVKKVLNLLGVDPLWRDAVKGAVILFAILMDQWERKV